MQFLIHCYAVWKHAKYSPDSRNEFRFFYIWWTKPSDAKVLCGGISTSDEVQTPPKGAFCNDGGTATNLVMSDPGTFSQCSPFPQSQEGRLRRTFVLSKWQRAVRWPCTVTRVRGWQDPSGWEQVPLRGYSGQHTILAPISLKREVRVDPLDQSAGRASGGHRAV